MYVWENRQWTIEKKKRASERGMRATILLFNHGAWMLFWWCQDVSCWIVDHCNIHTIHMCVWPCTHTWYLLDHEKENLVKLLKKGKIKKNAQTADNFNPLNWPRCFDIFHTHTCKPGKEEFGNCNAFRPGQQHRQSNTCNRDLSSFEIYSPNTNKWIWPNRPVRWVCVTHHWDSLNLREPWTADRTVVASTVLFKNGPLGSIKQSATIRCNWHGKKIKLFQRWRAHTYSCCVTWTVQVWVGTVTYTKTTAKPTSPSWLWIWATAATLSSKTTMRLKKHSSRCIRVIVCCLVGQKDMPW